MYIIAEIGSNYHTLEQCIDSICLAKKAGASAVKFQHFTAKEMWGSGTKEVTPIDWLPQLRAAAEAAEIEFSCTFFSPEKLKSYMHMLDFIKIASSNMMDVDLLNVAANSGKRTYLSCGGHTLEEAVRVLRLFPLAKFLYCESVYPSYVNDYDKLKKFPFAGISDHSLDIYPSYYNQVRIVEKHVNLCGVNDTPDAPHSLNFDEFSRFCEYLHTRPELEMLSKEEQGMRDLHNVRLIAAVDIPAGKEVRSKDLVVRRGVKVQADYINPMDKDLVVGKTLKVDVKAGEAIAAGSIYST